MTFVHVDVAVGPFGHELLVHLDTIFCAFGRCFGSIWTLFLVHLDIIFSAFGRCFGSIWALFFFSIFCAFGRYFGSIWTLTFGAFGHWLLVHFAFGFGACGSFCTSTPNMAKTLSKYGQKQCPNNVQKQCPNNVPKPTKKTC